MYLFPLVPEVVQEVAVRDVLCDETERLLDGDAANQIHDVVVVPFRYLLHHLDLGEKVRPLFPSGCVCEQTES